jgi:uncharacterized protein (DUF2336 family)
MASTSALLKSELDAVDRWPLERRAETLHQIARLFLGRAQSLAANQIALFDEVFVRLIDHVDTPSLAQLSRQLSEAKCVLPRCSRRLAFHDDERVAIPVLKLACLTPELVLDVAKSCGLTQRRAIAGRYSVDPSVAAALIDSGDTTIYHALADNLGANFSEADWVRLVQIAEGDQELAKKLVSRADIPIPLKNGIHARLGNARMRELNAMPRVVRDQIENTIAAADATKKSAELEPDYAAAHASMVELNRKGKLNDSVINRFAVRHDYTNVVAALAFLTGSPVEVIAPLIASDSVEGLVVACKASRLDWATAFQIVKNRPGHSQVSAAELEKAKATFAAISISAAQRTVRF